MKCCNRHCNRKAIGTVEKVFYRRCHICESNYKSRLNRAKHPNIDIGRGICYYQRCNKFAGRNPKGMCNAHWAYHEKARSKRLGGLYNQPYRIPQYKSANLDRLDQDIPSLPTYTNCTTEKFIKLAERKLEEIYG